MMQRDENENIKTLDGRADEHVLREVAHTSSCAAEAAAVSENRRPASGRGSLLLFLTPRKAVFAVILAGMLLRLIGLGWFPGRGGINQDEAFSAYNAWSLLHYGTDASGYSWPVYLEAWGSGMNVLQSLLMLPFIALFGLNAFAIRLPQALLGCLSLPAFYGVIRRISGERAALIGTALLAFCPWHIMLSRWALESNNQPALLLFAVFFLLKALDSEKWLLLSALFFGLSLYAYAATWVILPFLILFMLLYLWWRAGLKPGISWLAAAAILAALALPLLAFVLINKGLLSSFSIGPITIPKLAYFRGAEVSLTPAVLAGHLAQTLRMLLAQSDGHIWNSVPFFGFYYPFTIIFFALGIGQYFSRRRRAQGDLQGLMMIWLVLALLLGCLIDVNVNRLNVIHLPVIFFSAEGLAWFSKKVARRNLRRAVFALYAVCAAAFLVYYFTAYNSLLSRRWSYGLGEALRAADEQHSEQHSEIVADSGDISYALVLYYEKYPTERYVKSVRFYNPGAKFQRVRSFGNFYFEKISTADEIDTEKVYLCRKDNTGAIRCLQNAELTCVERDGNYCVFVH